MTRRRIVAPALALAVLLILAVADAATVGLAARVVSVGKSTSTVAYSTVDPVTWAKTGTANWTVVNALGDCCENYLGITPAGRLFDLGGDVLDYSDTRGSSWTEVRPNPSALIGAEGGASVAPNGDIVGFTWDPYSGDRVTSYKFSAIENKWYFLEGNLHTPFADRPWIGVIPGPFVIGGVSVPYISVFQAGAGTKEVLFVSYDGLSYAAPQSSLADALTNLPTSRWLDPVAVPALDAMQGNTRSAIVPLAGVGALAKSIVQAGCPYRILDARLRWSCFTFPDGSTFHGEVQVDSKGRLHDMEFVDSNTFDYRISSDGGRTWSHLAIAIPSLYDIHLWDFKASGSSDVTALALDTARGVNGPDQHVVIKISTANVSAAVPPVITKVAFVGKGDYAFSHALNQAGSARFDFSSVVLFADGKVAVSFSDSAHLSPGVAIEL